MLAVGPRSTKSTEDLCLAVIPVLSKVLCKLFKKLCEYNIEICSCFERDKMFI